MSNQNYDLESIMDDMARAYVSAAPESMELGDYEALDTFSKFAIKQALMPVVNLAFPFIEKAVVEKLSASIEVAESMGLRAKDAIAVF